ncbi:MAG: precorrin-3B C(17)-methyltransferase [Deltaproteobacteria bacterium]|nr:precorrin-3B C(17)-methyltransferase [Deltaproteobacteria bacterium]
MRSRSLTRGPDGPPGNDQNQEPPGHPGRGAPAGRQALKLTLIGLGSGGGQGLTLAAKKGLYAAEAVYGYGLYLEQAGPFIRKAEIHASGMTAEMKRAGAALDSALSGRRTVVVSGGDTGVYGMAGAVFEVAAARNLDLGPGPGRLSIEVLPGVPAVVAGAALLGAPLTHDFCLISLSDRLTPWELIEKRLDLAAQGDFVIALYNPKSRGRNWQLGRALEILARRLGPRTPAGLVSRAGRAGQLTLVTTLDELGAAQVDMQTLIIIGSSRTFIYQGYLITPRGYVDKYGGPLPAGRRKDLL